MQERQVTIGKQTFPLPEPFLVLATQNPIEQEGTYPLPEAQVDRFMLKVVIDYPKLEEEKLIIRQNINGEKFNVKPILKADEILEARKVVRQVYLDVAHDVLRHRIGLTYEAEASNMTSDEIISKILNKVEVP